MTENGPDKLCECSTPEIASLASIRCARCGGLLTTPSKLEEANEITQEGTQGCRDRNPAGNALVAAGKGGDCYTPDRRTAIALIFGFFASVLAIPAGRRLGVELGIPELEDEAIRKARADALSDEDLEMVKSLLRQDPSNLRVAVIGFNKSGRYALAKLLYAVDGQKFGIAYEQSIISFTELLELAESDNVKCFLHLRRSKALGCMGKKSEAVDDVDAAISLPGLKLENRISVVRQGIQLAYSSVLRDQILMPESWTDLKRYRAYAFSQMGIKTEGQNPRDLYLRANSYHPTLAAGISIFDALLGAAEAKDSPKDCREVLNWHLILIRRMQEFDPENGWNRYSPFAAQAMHRNHMDIAEQALKEARMYADGELTGRVAEQAIYQRHTKGTEWLLHRVLFAALYLLRAEHAASAKEGARLRTLARDELAEPIMVINHDVTGKTQVFAGAAKYYDRRARLGDRQADRDGFAEGNSSPWFSHWTYLPMPSGWDSLRANSP